uniref:COR domain-containing protein n=1 Tax=Magallana gigas TaxID=29159 RepID=A0A8W8NYB5_MAGGI
MGLLLFRAFLVINAFYIATENPVTPNPYRFPVYSVNECPRSQNEFITAAQRRNCTGGSRYLCVPNKYISSLIEFCTDRSRSLYGKGFCVLLEGTGDLNHYSCVEKFNSSCPSEPYYDEDIFKYPACLEIDKELRCFVADNNCNKRELPTVETPLNISKMETVGNETFRRASPRLLAIVYTIAVVSAGMILIWVIFQKRRKEQGERYKKNDENMSLLKDPEPLIEQNDDVQLEQTTINVSKHNQIHTTSTEMISETVKKDTQKSKMIQKEEKQNEESGYKTATLDGKQQHNPEIDDDKLRQFLSKGNISVCHIRCVIVGCGKAGKTTLLKRLQNASFDELMRIERTEMVDFHVNSFEVLLKEKTIQSVNKEDTLPTILFSKEKLEMGLKATAGQKTEEEADQPGVRGNNLFVEKSSQKKTENIPRDVPKTPANNNDAEKERESIPEPQDKIFVQNQLSPNTNETHDKDIETNEDDKINFEKYAILKIKDAVNELLNETDMRPRITFLDFAGQSMYYAFHQIFLRPKSCSILVVDMTKSLNDIVDFQDENEKECSQFASWRFRDYYTFWLRSIDSFSDTESPVIIVGTHADKLSKEECRKFLKSLNEHFDNWSHSGLRRHLNEDRMYTIGFPDSGSELEDLKDLKKCIANIVKCPRYSKENIRPVWALFEHILNKMKETEKVIPRKTLSDYNDQLGVQELRIDQSEISKMLVFFHRVGVLLYFDKDGLKEKIILDIQWLLDAFKCIIEYPVKTEDHDMKRRHFKRTGELDNVELDRIWHDKEKYFLKHKTTIIEYMQQLGLLMPLINLHSRDSTVYYFPSMNSKRFDKTGENNSKSSIICFKFSDEMQLPINVFHGIVLKCSKLNNWSILTEGAKNNICLYQNAACFSFQNHIVVLFNCNIEIRVQVWASPEIYNGRLLKKIKHSVEDIIHDDDLSYEIGYKCRKDVLKDEEDVSFISQNIFPVSNHLCEICDVDKKHIVDNDICWDLEENDENQDKAEHIGSWAENIESGDLHRLFCSFCIKIPEDHDRLSFTKDILGESKLAEFVKEIKYLARNVVLYKYLKDEEKKPGTVYVYEVNVKYTANQVVIEEKDARQKSDFFQRKNQNLVKVILIKGGFHSVLQAKKKAYQKYQQTRCKITADHLKMIADLLEEFTSSIHLNEQDTRSWEES